MILTKAQMIEAEGETFARGVPVAELMESAGRQMAAMVRQFHPSPGTCRVFAGKGHNGGDVLIAARHLAAQGWALDVKNVFSSPLPLPSSPLHPPSSFPSPLVVLDGLLGIGASGDPREPIASAIHEINRLRAHEAAWVLAADIPSGLDADTGLPGRPCVRADATITMGFVKPGLVADSATDFVGRLAVAELPDVCAPDSADPAWASTPSALRAWLPPRAFDMHKGLCGRVAVLAGSPGFTGAARLCSEAAVLGGAGLVTLFAPNNIYPSLAANAAPEVMVRPVEKLAEVLHDRWDAIAIGPGLGPARRAEILDVLELATCPCVVDADALNALAGHLQVLSRAPAPRLLTPHPGEMERLDPRRNRTRLAWMREFVGQYPVTLLLKGSRTIIGEKNHAPVFNTTGHPGMASGGMGDVLTGVCAALIAQGKSPRESAILGAWACGRAAEIAIINGDSQESLRAHTLAASLGHAFNTLRAGCL